MKGLLLKDYCLLRNNAILLFVVLVAVCVFLSIMFGTVIFVVLPTILSIIMSSLVFNTITIDKMSRWNMIVATFPVHRQTILREKYLLYSITTLIGALFGAVLCLVRLVLFNDPEGIENNYLMYSLCSSIGFPLMAGSINLPISIFTELGEAFNAVSMIISYVIVAGITIVFGMSFQSFPPEKQLTIIALLTAAISIVMFILSFVMMSSFQKKQNRIKQE